MWGQGTGQQPSTHFVFGQPANPGGGQPAQTFAFGPGAAPDQAAKVVFGNGASPAQAQNGRAASPVTFGSAGQNIQAQWGGRGQSQSPLAGRLSRGQQDGANEARQPAQGAMGSNRSRPGGVAPGATGAGRQTTQADPQQSNLLQQAILLQDDDVRRANRAARFGLTQGAAAGASNAASPPRPRSPALAGLRRTPNTSAGNLAALGTPGSNGMDAQTPGTATDNGAGPSRKPWPTPGSAPGTPALAAAQMGDDDWGFDDYDDDEECTTEPIVGTCEYMCPVEERKEREGSGNVHPLEQIEDGNSRLTSPDVCVKKCVRNYDEHQLIPSNFRTWPALVKTMDHLLRVMDWTKADHPRASPMQVYDFLWDRFREVRREVKTQRFDKSGHAIRTVLAWNETICRWMLLIGHELGEDKQFQAQLNQEQMNKALMDIKIMYDKLAKRGIQCPNAPEFKCYHAIMLYGGLLNKQGSIIPNRNQATELIRSFTEQERESPWYHIMLAVMQTISKRDVYGFWQLARTGPYVLACVMDSQFTTMQEQGLRQACVAYDSSEDPDNLVPVAGVKEFVWLGPGAIKFKVTRLLGGTVDTNDEIRFPGWGMSNARPVPDRKRTPWISSKRTGLIAQASSQAPDLSDAFLAAVARVNAVLQSAATTLAAELRQRAETWAATVGRGSSGARSLGSASTVSPAPSPKPVLRLPASAPAPSSALKIERPAVASPSLAVAAAKVFGPAAAAAAQAPVSFKPEPGLVPVSAQQQQEASRMAADAQREQAMQRAAADAQRLEEARRAVAEAEAARRHAQQVMQESLLMEQRALQEAQGHQQAVQTMEWIKQQHEREQAQLQARLQAMTAEKEAAERALAERELRDRLKDMEQEVAAYSKRKLLERALAQWREALKARKEREQKLRVQMSQCRVSSFSPTQALAAALRSPRFGSFSEGSLTKRPCLRLPAGEARAATAAVTPQHAALVTPLPLTTLLQPALQEALRAGGWEAPPGAAGRRTQQRPVQELPLWKLVLCSGLHSAGPRYPAPPLSTAHAIKAAWLQQKLSAGREEFKTAPPSGSVLTFRLPATQPPGLPQTLTQASQSIIVCVEDVNAAAVADEPCPVPEHSCPSLSAASGILLLVDGPEDEWPADQPLPADLQASLSRSWTQLQQLLSRLAPQTKLPVVLLLLASQSGLAAVRAHFQQCVATWPAALLSHMSKCSLLPLRDGTHTEDQVLAEALQRYLALLAPTPFLTSAGCPDHTPTTGPNSPRWALHGPLSAHLAGANIAGPPARLPVQTVVHRLLEQCLSDHMPAPMASSSSGQDHDMDVDTHEARSAAQMLQAKIVDTFNASLEALGRGIHATASNTLASWGLPAPELTTDPHAAAPNCWQPSRIQQAEKAVLAARVPCSALTTLPAPQAAPGEEALAAYRQVARLLRSSCEDWHRKQQLLGQPLYCVLLPKYQPGWLASATGSGQGLPLKPFAWTEHPAPSQHANGVASPLLLDREAQYARPRTMERPWAGASTPDPSSAPTSTFHTPISTGPHHPGSSAWHTPLSQGVNHAPPFNQPSSLGYDRQDTRSSPSPAPRSLHLPGTRPQHSGHGSLLASPQQPATHLGMDVWEEGGEEGSLGGGGQGHGPEVATDPVNASVERTLRKLEAVLEQNWME